MGSCRDRSRPSLPPSLLNVSITTLVGVKQELSHPADTLIRHGRAPSWHRAGGRDKDLDLDLAVARRGAGQCPWRPLEEHISDLREQVDDSIGASQDLRGRYRQELLAANPDLPSRIRRPSAEALEAAITLMSSGVVAAADGTVAPYRCSGEPRSRSAS